MSDSVTILGASVPIGTMVNLRVDDKCYIGKVYCSKTESIITLELHGVDDGVTSFSFDIDSVFIFANINLFEVQTLEIDAGV